MKTGKLQIGFKISTLILVAVLFGALLFSIKAFAGANFSISVQPQEGASSNEYSLCRVSDQSGEELYNDNFDWDAVKTHYGWSGLSNVEVVKALKDKLNPDSVEGSDIGFLARSVKASSGIIKNDNIAATVEDGSYILTSMTAVPMICGVGYDNPAVILAEKNDVPVNEFAVKGYEEEYASAAFLGQDRMAYCKCNTILPKTFLQFESYPLVFGFTNDQMLSCDKDSVKVMLDDDIDITSLANLEVDATSVTVSFSNLMDKDVEAFKNIKDGSVIELTLDFTADAKAPTGISSPSISSKITYPLSPTSTETSDTIEAIVQTGLIKLNVYSITSDSKTGVSGTEFKIENSNGQYLDDNGLFVDESQATIFTSDSNGLVNLDFALGCDKYTIHQMNHPQELTPSSDETSVEINAQFNRDNLLTASDNDGDITIDVNANGAGVVSNVDASSGIITINIEQTKPELWEVIVQTLDNKFLIVIGIALILICSSLVYLYSKKNKSTKGNSYGK